MLHKIEAENFPQLFQNLETPKAKLRIAQQVSCISTPSWFLEANVKREGSKGSDATASEGLSESLDLTDLLDSRSRGDFGTRGERGGVREGAPRARASSVFVVAAASAPPRRDRVLGPLCAPPLGLTLLCKFRCPDRSDPSPV